jgi:SAM-dependent methyltransferase
MPTIPPEHAPPPRPEPHLHRRIAEGFGADPERYDRARPSYPAALVERLVAASPGPEFVDVGTGTGIAARQFQAAGCSVLGVDPDERVAEVARRGGLEVEVSTFETWDPAGRAFDAVVAGQAWHWVDPVAGAAKAARVLRPGGLLAVFWNAFQPPAGLREDFAEVYRRVRTGLPFNPWARQVTGAYDTMAGTAEDGIRQAGAFGEPERWSAGCERPCTRDEWLDMVPTAGGHAQLPRDTLAELLAGLGAAIDAAGGGFTAEFTTVAVTATRAGPGG